MDAENRADSDIIPGCQLGWSPGNNPLCGSICGRLGQNPGLQISMFAASKAEMGWTGQWLKLRGGSSDSGPG